MAGGMEEVQRGGALWFIVDRNACMDDPEDLT